MNRGTVQSPGQVLLPVVWAAVAAGQARRGQSSAAAAAGRGWRWARGWSSPPVNSRSTLKHVYLPCHLF